MEEMTYDSFKKEIRELGFATEEDLDGYANISDESLDVWDCKRKRLLATVSKKEHYVFEFYSEMLQEFYVDKKADQLIDLVAKLAKVPIKYRNINRKIKPSDVFYGMPQCYMIKPNEDWDDEDADHYTSIHELEALESWCNMKVFEILTEKDQ